MTLEELLHEGCIAGLSLEEMEEMTCGEVVETILARREGERRAAQRLSIIAYREAELMARALLTGRLPEVYEAFPFWEEEEIKRMKLEKYRKIMEAYAAGGKAVKKRE